MDKRISIQVNCNRKVTGILRGFDAFMNIVLDETFEECKTGTLPMGTVVSEELEETLYKSLFLGSSW